ncbi:Acetokinase family-domain-containing protein [Bombardia bombarda]|uniref:Probable acetate kinase n=1 Tax=Bombardia bombarda TaxID=252184 RepID=A0AA39TIN9_9PEZI|nr:Acetokinase family-domain-containing protein [Bombardia bombarda]
MSPTVTVTVAVSLPPHDPTTQAMASSSSGRSGRSGQSSGRSGRSGQSGSSSSSFNSSALGAPPSYAQQSSPADLTFTPTSVVSALSSSSSAPLTPLGPLDLGPPGYHAVIKLPDQLTGERTLYLGPWEIVGTSSRRIVWQCSYQGEVLEHFLPSDNAADLIPYTLHAQHRRFGDPREMELYLAFREPHRVRYTTNRGVEHDEFIEVKYEFTTVEGSMQFQSDVRTRDLVDWFDVDVVWSDNYRRTDAYGNVRGLGTIQRMKLWRDRVSTVHYLTFYANHRRRWKEYRIDDFDEQVQHQDDRHRRLQLNVRGARRGSAPDSTTQGSSRNQRFSAASIFRPRQPSSSSVGPNGTYVSSSAVPGALDIRYIGIQFTRNDRITPESDVNNTTNETDSKKKREMAATKTKKIILSVNAGSSSVKISVYTAKRGQSSPEKLAEASISGLTAPPPTLDYARRGETVTKSEKVKEKADNPLAAFGVLLKTLIDDADLPEISSKSDIGIVCHRIVHGGDYTRAVVISDETYHHLETINDLAPLHNSNSLAIVKTCVDELPAGTHNVACFDSQFHATIPPHIHTYPIDREIAHSNRLRKYGFHGMSYAFITRSAAEFLGKKVGEVNLIALHLGSGASACAIKDGESWDTSMGLTPLAGLPGATRSGSVDPSLVFHYAGGADVGKLSPASTRDLHISRAEEILNKEAGWKAMTGTTDFGKIAAGVDSDPKMALAFDLFVDRVSAFVGSYYVSLHGRVDALVFAGGIGERSDRLRAAVVKNVECLGFELDEEKNGRGGEFEGGDEVVADVGVKGARHGVLVVKTDEQFEMARSCAEDEELW